MSYLFDPTDGKIHTRYSELKVCTPSQIWRVIRHREQPRQLSTLPFSHGRVRHELWAEESLKTGRLPICFELPELAGRPVEYVEQEVVGEILPGVVLHGRIDCVMDDMGTVVDYKTMTAKDLKSGNMRAHDIYRNSKQLKLYAYLLGLNGYRIRRGRYLVEFWDDDYKVILGYAMVEQEISMRTIGPVLAWAEDRVALLVSAFEADVKKVT